MFRTQTNMAMSRLNIASALTIRTPMAAAHQKRYASTTTIRTASAFMYQQQQHATVNSMMSRCSFATTTTNIKKATPSMQRRFEATSINQRNYRNWAVSSWLYFTGAMVGGVVVVGGMTRLTESGLSIVDWRPVTGVIPPRTDAEWEAEFGKYKHSPEFKQKSSMTLDEFKTIFFWEWGHRALARSLGIVYGVPMVYFLARGYFAGHPVLKLGLAGLFMLGGAQGALGWYMVKSGLDPKLLDEKKKATVSAYRLAAHLSLAFLLYSSMMRIGMGLRLPASPSFPGKFSVQSMSRISTGVMFTTAISGAFVAGLDAGMLYSDGFPLMGGRIAPPLEELTTIDPWYRNLFENPVAAQTWHRVMAGTTTCCILLTNVVARRPGASVPWAVKKALWVVNGALVLQVSLGVATIVTQVHIHTAASHQFGSMVLLTALIRLCAVLGSRGTILV